MATRTIRDGFRTRTITRTSERPLLYSAQHGYVTRNLWEDRDGKKYVQFRGDFYKAVKGGINGNEYTITFRVSKLGE